MLGKMKKRTHEHEFLPAALEIQESPPSPIGRMILWVIVSFFVVAVVWAVVGEVDIVAVAQGKIIPGGRIKEIQPLEIGIIRKIHVEEGQEVEKGQILIELDPTNAKADRQRLEKELQQVQLEVIRHSTFNEWIKDNTKDIKWDSIFPKDVDHNTAQLQADILKSQTQEYQSKMAALDSEISRKHSEYRTTQAMVEKLTQTLPIIKKRANSLKKLAKTKLVAENTWLEIEQQRIEQVKDLQAQKSRMEEISTSITEAEQKKNTVAAESSRNILTELGEAKRKQQALTQELVKAQQKSDLQYLSAPVSGVVQQLAVHTIGGVVTPAQKLMMIVPKDQKLEIEAYVLNKDIGFVSEGQQSEIKIDAFPFTKYGTIDGNVVSLSNDAIADEQRGLIYAARISMDKKDIVVNEKTVNLSPGMTVAVEMKTGKRKLIEYFLSPLLKYRSESIRER